MSNIKNYLDLSEFDAWNLYDTGKIKFSNEISESLFRVKPSFQSIMNMFPAIIMDVWSMTINYDDPKLKQVILGFIDRNKDKYIYSSLFTPSDTEGIVNSSYVVMLAANSDTEIVDRFDQYKRFQYLE